MLIKIRVTCQEFHQCASFFSCILMPVFITTRPCLPRDILPFIHFLIHRDELYLGDLGAISTFGSGNIFGHCLMSVKIMSE